MILAKIIPGKLAFGNITLRKRAGEDVAEEIAETPDSPASEAKWRLPLPKSIRFKANKMTLALGTGAAIFAIGFVMQGVGGPAVPVKSEKSAFAPGPKGGIEVRNLALTSFDNLSDALPRDMEAPAIKGGLINAARGVMADGIDSEQFASLQDPAMPLAMKSRTPTPDIPALADTPQINAEPASAPVRTAAIGTLDATPLSPESAPALACDVSLTADPAPMAMVDLIVDASCLPNERFTLHHNGMMFHAVTDDSGWQALRVPALATKAVFIVSFLSDHGAVAQVGVPTLSFYDRVAVQWRGSAGLGLHALEFGAEYFGSGHIHNGARGDLAATGAGSSGFLTRFGHNAGPDALQAEIYTFASQATQSAGNIALSVEAEVTKANCGAEVEAQTLQIHPGGKLRIQDVTLYMPECDATGDFLVLKNLLEDLKVASN